MQLQQNQDHKLAVPAEVARETALEVSPVESLKACPPALRRAIQLAGQGDPEAALMALRPLGQAPDTMNATAVCLMRLGRIEEALKIYRGMVMKPGCTWMRPEAPLLYKINFATALLLSGTPAGCLSALNDIDRAEHPTVQRLYGAVRKWESELSFWRRWDWRISHVEPPNCRVTLDFEPGQFVDHTAATS